MNGSGTCALAENPMNILLVDDDDGDAKAVRRAFGKYGAANPVVRARDGVEALDILRGPAANQPEAPFILLLDINMPRMSGHEFLSELRKDPRLRRLVVFVLTTSDDAGDVERAYGQNVAGYILKKNAGSQCENLIRAVREYWQVVALPDVQ